MKTFRSGLKIQIPNINRDLEFEILNLELFEPFIQPLFKHPLPQDAILRL